MYFNVPSRRFIRNVEQCVQVLGDFVGTGQGNPGIQRIDRSQQARYSEAFQKKIRISQNSPTILIMGLSTVNRSSSIPRAASTTRLRA